MTRSITTCLLTIAMASPAFAQGKALADALDRMHTNVARNVVEAAEKMPEAEFAFQPTKDVRTFAGFVGHVANSEFGYCARVKGEANPNKQDFEKIVVKAALVAGLKAAVAYCDTRLQDADRRRFVRDDHHGAEPATARARCSCRTSATAMSTTATW